MVEKIVSLAFELYDIGLNVFPQPKSKTYGYPNKHLTYTRIARSSINDVFQGNVNLAVRAGGRKKPYTFFINCKTDKTFIEQVDTLNTRDMPVWAVKAKVGGQLWFWSSYGRVENKETDFIHVIGSHGYVMSPPSIDAHGIPYWWYQQDGDTPPLVQPYEDLSWLELVRESPSEVGFNLRERLNEWRNNLLEVEDDDYIPSNNTSNAISHTTKAAYYLQFHHQWQGREGITDLAVVKAIFDRTRIFPGVSSIIRASNREIAELARLDKDTVNESLLRLQKTSPPILERVNNDRLSGAYQYRFGKKMLRIGRETYIKESPAIGTLSFMLNTLYINTLIDEYPELIEKDALGIVAVLIWGILFHLQRPLKLGDLTRWTGLSDRVVRRACQHLEAVNLIVHKARSYQSIDFDEETLTTIIEATHARDKMDSRRSKNEEDREKYAAYKIIEHRNKYN